MRQLLRSCLLPFLGILLGAGLAAAQVRDQDNIVVVLDASGSMKEPMKGSRLNRMQAAKQALTQVMNQVPEKTNVGLLVFSGANVPTEWLYPLGPLDRAKMNAAIQRPQPAGPTPLGTYLKKGADTLLEQRKKQHDYGTFRLLIVTDGEPMGEPAGLVDRYLPDVLSRGITVDVIGVDMKANHSLATRVHSYRRADNPEQLTKAVSAVFAEVGSAKDTVADAEAFAILQALPDEMAKTMLTALASPGNHPIGEKPAVQAAPSESTPSSTTAPVHAAAPPPNPSPNPKSEGGSMGWWFVLLLVLAAGGWWAVRSQQQVRRRP
jgi:hypothetical protein